MCVCMYDHITLSSELHAKDVLFLIFRMLLKSIKTFGGGSICISFVRLLHKIVEQIVLEVHVAKFGSVTVLFKVNL